MGVVPLHTPRTNSILICLVKDTSITELWQLDVLGNECLKKCAQPGAAYTCKTIKRLAKTFYVDNRVHSFITQSSMIVAEATFDLRGWKFTRNNRDESATIPVLGLSWLPGNVR